MVATSMVLQLPPSESSRMRVSLESRYGTWPRAPPRESVSAAITLPSALKLWLIFLLSSKRLPAGAPQQRQCCVAVDLTGLAALGDRRSPHL